ncbi:hypothetical protein Kpho02_11540 [Kitasatospora phosalacinea]|uniref:WD40 repeat protein n=1 Tax=Kitasatospora phosalacinea TaxID=2065 RepID=A0A9W6V1F2_9ACTN|nr:hypothetical protein [Kitasatospora phosalacinea]GLW68855.1 hypothetical protein Kpho02_11540 [Kitasatospora phosalacinea]
MNERARLRRSAAALLVAASTTGSALLLTACDPEGEGTGTAASSPATAATTAAPAGGGSLNRTAGTRLTVSTGTSTVLMDGKAVDFGTVVRDLAWSPDGKHAAFVDGNGNLETSDPDGSHKVVVAKAPSGTTWSHPTWQVFGADEPHGAGTYLLFTADDKKSLRLMSVEARAGAKPEVLHVGDSEGAQIPETGNQWPNSNGLSGMTVYANKDDGQVYFHDVVSRTNGGAVAKGSQPALADEGALVFVRSAKGHSHVFASPGDENADQQIDLTPDATVDCTEPAISHDGRTVAFRGPDGVYTVPFTGGKPEKVTDTVGLPAYR